MSLVDKIEGVDIDWPDDFYFAEIILNKYNIKNTNNPENGGDFLTRFYFQNCIVA